MTDKLYKFEYDLHDYQMQITYPIDLPGRKRSKNKMKKAGACMSCGGFPDKGSNYCGACKLVKDKAAKIANKKAKTVW